MRPSDLGILVENDCWRNGQYEAALKGFGTSKRFIGDCMPTGWGKSIRLIAQAVISGGRTLILTSSRELQNQYAREFANLGILDIKGKSNYLCRAQEVGGEFYDGTPAGVVTDAPCQFGEECGLKLFGCTYYDKINQAKYKKIVSANYAAWISANLYTEGWGRFDLVCCDEAHEAEDWLARMLAVRLPKCYARLVTSKMPHTTNVAMWVNWAGRELPMVRAAIRLEKKEISTSRRKRLAKLRTLQSLEADLTKMRSMSSEWRVFYQDQHILFQPIWVHEYAEKLLFSGARKVVFASSTMVPNTLNLLGILDSEMDFSSYPSTFPIARRPIYYMPTVRMRYGMSEEEEKQWISVVDDFISQRLDRKGVIHTVSYARQNTLLKYSRFASLMIPSSPSSTSGNSIGSVANLALQRFRMAQAPAILIGPNWSTGIDLKYGQCEYTIIPKVPFADITDPLHVARSEDNPDQGWYDAGIKLTQSIGRAMRADDDQNETLITDSTFGKYLSVHRRMIPDWCLSAVQNIKKQPVPLGKL